MESFFHYLTEAITLGEALLALCAVGGTSFGTVSVFSKKVEHSTEVHVNPAENGNGNGHKWTRIFATSTNDRLKNLEEGMSKLFDRTEETNKNVGELLKRIPPNSDG